MEKKYLLDEEKENIINFIKAFISKFTQEEISSNQSLKLNITPDVTIS